MTNIHGFDLRLKFSAVKTRLSVLLGLMSLLLVCSSLFSFSFPFAKQIWMREHWGLTALVNAMIFFLFSSFLEKNPLSVSMGTLGLIFNEQLRTWYTLFDLMELTELGHEQIYFGVFSVIICLGMTIACIDLIRWYFLFSQEFHLKSAASDDPNAASRTKSSTLLALSLWGYGSIFGTIYLSRFLDPVMQFSMLKTLSSLASMTVFFVIAKEVQRWQGGVQTLLTVWMKALTHLLLLASVLLWTYRWMPTQEMLILSPK